MSTEKPEGGAPPEPQKMTIAVHYGQGVTPPEGAVPSADVMLERTADVFRSYGVDEAVLQQRGQPVSREEYTLAEHRKSSLVRDKGFVARWMDGDVEALKTMATLSIILGSKIKDEANG
jgi:hypothetical protein